VRGIRTGRERGSCMAGHSKWNNIKRKKGAADAKRGQLFTKLSKEIQVAARMGGGDPDANPRLRLAVANARASSMPVDNITRAIKKGTGELEGGEIEELVYEGYGPGGVAFMMEVATDNQNRTLGEVRKIFDKAGGSFAKSGAVAFLFDKVGRIRLDAGRWSEEQVMEAALEAGAEDVRTEDGQIVVQTAVADFHRVQQELEGAGFEVEASELAMIPSTHVSCDEDLAKRTLGLFEKLEEHDDVQHVWSNFDIPDAIMDRLEDES